MLTLRFHVDMIALINDIHVRILTLKQAGIGGHAHTRRRDAIAGHWPAARIPFHVKAVRDTTNALVAGRIAISACYSLAINPPESRQSRAATDLLASRG